jgi:hypothetical protein
MEGFRPNSDQAPKKKGGGLGYAAALAAGAIGGAGLVDMYHDSQENGKNKMELPAQQFEIHKISRLSFENKKAIVNFLIDPTKGLTLNLAREEVGELGKIEDTIKEVHSEALSDPSGQYFESNDSNVTYDDEGITVTMPINTEGVDIHDDNMIPNGFPKKLDGDDMMRLLFPHG